MHISGTQLKNLCNVRLIRLSIETYTITLQAFFIVPKLHQLPGLKLGAFLYCEYQSMNLTTDNEQRTLRPALVARQAATGDKRHRTVSYWLSLLDCQ